jgi:hypothetical protein
MTQAITILQLNEGEPSPFALDAELVAYTREQWLKAKPEIIELTYLDGEITIEWSIEPTEQDLADIQALREGRYNIGANLGV